MINTPKYNTNEPDLSPLGLVEPKKQSSYSLILEIMTKISLFFLTIISISTLSTFMTTTYNNDFIKLWVNCLSDGFFFGILIVVVIFKVLDRITSKKSKSDMKHFKIISIILVIMSNSLLFVLGSMFIEKNHQNSIFLGVFLKMLILIYDMIILTVCYLLHDLITHNKGMYLIFMNKSFIYII